MPCRAARSRLKIGLVARSRRCSLVRVRPWASRTLGALPCGPFSIAPRTRIRFACSLTSFERGRARHRWHDRSIACRPRIGRGLPSRGVGRSFTLCVCVCRTALTQTSADVECSPLVRPCRCPAAMVLSLPTGLPPATLSSWTTTSSLPANSGASVEALTAVATTTP